MVTALDSNAYVRACLHAASTVFGAIKTFQSITPRLALYPMCLTPAVTHFVFTVENSNGCQSVVEAMVLSRRKNLEAAPSA